MCKIRNGFVSNSSSSSFLVYGVSLNSYDISEDDLLKVRDTIVKIAKSYKGDNERLKTTAKNLLDIFEDDNDLNYLRDVFYDILEDVFMFNENDIDINYIDDEIIVGSYPEGADDSITFGEWKKDIRKDVQFLFPFLDDKKFQWIEDCSYDG